MNETKQLSNMKQTNPFSQGTAMQAPGGNALAQSDQGRAIAEVQAAMIVARQSPRNQSDVVDKIISACTRPSLAESAVYQYSRGGTDISGPSIRLAEAIAQQWGNIQFGFNELSRGVDHDGVTYSEIGAYAWDLESNTRRPLQFRVRHWRDTKNGGYALKEERDIYELIANQAQRRVRACILAVIPGDVTEIAVRQCEATLKATADTTTEGTTKLLEAFGMFGVTKEQIEKRIQRNLDSIKPGQVASLKKIYASLRDGISSVSDWFEVDANNINSMKKRNEVKGESKKVDDDKPAGNESDGKLATQKKKEEGKPDIKTEEIQENEPFVPSAEEQEAIRAREIAESESGQEFNFE